MQRGPPSLRSESRRTEVLQVLKKQSPFLDNVYYSQICLARLLQLLYTEERVSVNLFLSVSDCQVAWTLAQVARSLLTPLQPLDWS